MMVFPSQGINLLFFLVFIINFRLILSVIYNSVSSTFSARGDGYESLPLFLFASNSLGCYEHELMLGYCP